MEKHHFTPRQRDRKERETKGNGRDMGKEEQKEGEDRVEKGVLWEMV